MTVSFDDKGLLVDSQDEVFNSMVISAKSKLAPYLGGTELQTDESSALGRILRVVSVPAHSNGEIIQTILNQFDINTAEGTQLDYLGWNIHRIKRLGLAQATGTAVLGGDIGVLISKGSQVSNSISGDVFQTQDDVVLDANSAVGFTLSIDTMQPNYSISYSINSYLSAYPQIEITIFNESTVQEVAVRLANAINSQSNLMTATLNNDSTITIMLNNQILTGDFSVSNGMSITQAFKPVAIASVTYQSVEAKVGAISKIQSSVLGWRSVYNYLPVFASRPVESDEEYRYRLNLCRGKAVGSYDAIWMRLMSIRGVSFVNVRENLKLTESNGIMNAGIAITIQGGIEDEIAQEIYDCIPVGIATSGTIEKTVLDFNGGQHSVKFSRPDQVQLQINMSITIYNDFPSNGKQLIKQAIVDWFNSLRVGDDIHYSRLYEPINSVRGFSVNSLKIAKVGDTPSTDNIKLNYNEIPIVTPDRIIIGGI